MPANVSAPGGRTPNARKSPQPALPGWSGKSRRLLKHADFQRVYERGRRQFTGNMTVFFLRRAPEAVPTEGPRVGLTVGKVLGGAVDRNRIKRRMREAVRHSPPCQGPLDVVFNPRKSVLTMPFDQLVGEVSRGLKLAEQRARPAEAK
jgi:ribonuclease P protein component